MFKDTCLVALGKSVVNLQILDPGSPHRLGLEIPRIVVAPKRDHLIAGIQSIKMQQTWIMNAWNESGCGSENFGAGITEIRFTVEKIWLFEVSGTYLWFWKVARVKSRNTFEFQGCCLKFYWIVAWFQTKAGASL
jgi:hypothetical protein